MNEVKYFLEPSIVEPTGMVIVYAVERVEVIVTVEQSSTLILIVGHVHVNSPVKVDWTLNDTDTSVVMLESMSTTLFEPV